jgi:hypothetical protein
VFSFILLIPLVILLVIQCKNFSQNKTTYERFSKGDKPIKDDENEEEEDLNNTLTDIDSRSILSSDDGGALNSSTELIKRNLLDAQSKRTCGQNWSEMCFGGRKQFSMTNHV